MQCCHKHTEAEDMGNKQRWIRLMRRQHKGVMPLNIFNCIVICIESLVKKYKNSVDIPVKL